MFKMFIMCEPFPSFPFPAHLLRSPQGTPRPWKLSLPLITPPYTTTSPLPSPIGTYDHLLRINLSYRAMPSCADEFMDIITKRNSFYRSLDPDSLPSYSEWSAKTTFDPFGSEPS